MADQAPEMMNIYLTEINDILTESKTMEINLNDEDTAYLGDFDIRSYVAQAIDMGDQFIDNQGNRKRFSDKICQ